MEIEKITTIYLKDGFCVLGRIQSITPSGDYIVKEPLVVYPQSGISKVAGNPIEIELNGKEKILIGTITDDKFIELYEKAWGRGSVLVKPNESIKPVILGK